MGVALSLQPELTAPGLPQDLRIAPAPPYLLHTTCAFYHPHRLCLRPQDLRNTPELIALAVNLTQNPRNAEVLCEGDRFDRLIRRAFQTCDELAFKVRAPYGWACGCDHSMGVGGLFVFQCS